MAVDAWPLVKEIAERYAREATTKGQPFEGSDIQVHDRFSLETDVLAIVYHVLDNAVLDNTMWYMGNTSRVVFHLTAASQQRANVTMLSRWIADNVAFTHEYLNQPATVEKVVRRPQKRLVGYDPTKLPELQELKLETIEGTAEEKEISNPIQMLSCYNEGVSVDFDSSLELWKGTCIFISVMSNVYPQEYIYA